MINFEAEEGRIYEHSCALCKINMGERAAYGLGSTEDSNILFGLSLDPLVITKDHGERPDRRALLYIADKIEPVVFRVYEKRGASGIMLATNYEGAADVKDHPHAHLQPIVRDGKSRLDLSPEHRGDVLLVVRELREGIEEVLSR